MRTTALPVFGVFLLTIVACGNGAKNEGSGGAGGETSTGGSTSAGGAGGAGGAAGGAGAGGGLGDCGDETCTADEICVSCTADYGGTEYHCSPKPPEAGAGEFACYDTLCQTGQYCTLHTSPYCAGFVVAGVCHDIDPTCVVDPQTCSCLGPPECTDGGCSADAEGNWTVQTMACGPP